MLHSSKPLPKLVPDRRSAPARRVVTTRGDEDVLECGHAVANPRDRNSQGRTYGVKSTKGLWRRCQKCVVGDPPTYVTGTKRNRALLKRAKERVKGNGDGEEEE